ncbi:hypothetical protein WMY93_025150 [Mugilogobius chulae]|uniref:Uncharacterized protein n=1 Tax=Mugilogobius chulae TaxID=88201 RepID=A0AAW0N6I3_9GOBI
MPTDAPEEDRLSANEDKTKCESMTLSSTPTVRRGSTPLPIKHQLRREEAVHDDADWASGAAGPSASPVRFSPAFDDTLTITVEGRSSCGPLRIALLGQNGVGKSSLAMALVGDMDRTASVDSDEAMSSAALYNCLYLEISASLDHRTPELLECAVRLARGQSPWPPGTSLEDMTGGGQKESITSRAKRFLSSLVPRYPKEREVGKFLRQKSRSCHDLGAL